MTTKVGKGSKERGESSLILEPSTIATNLSIFLRSMKLFMPLMMHLRAWRQLVKRYKLQVKLNFMKIKLIMIPRRITLRKRGMIRPQVGRHTQGPF